MDSQFAHSQYKYFAFISYNSRDIKWGKRLQKKLEHYRMPATLCSERGWVRTPIKPVFFAPTDIQSEDNVDFSILTKGTGFVEANSATLL